MRYEDVVLADGPIGYWPIAELTGTSVTALGSGGGTGAWTNTPVLGAVPFPAGGRAPYLGGSPYVVITDSPNWSSGAGASGVLTVEAWARPAVVHSDQAFIMAKGAGVGSYEWQLAISSAGLLTFDTISLAGSGSSRTSGAVAVGRWYHLVGTYDKAANLQVFYLNGRLVDTGTCAVTMGDGTSPLEIGRRSDSGGVLFNGHIAHCAIYSKVLSANRIGVHYQAGKRRRGQP